MRRTFGYNTYSDGVLGLSLTCFFRQVSVLVYNKNTITIKQMGDFVHLLIFFGSTNVQPAKLPEIYGAPPQTYERSMGRRPKRTRDLWGAAPNVRGIYGAPPHTPHAFLKKAWEKQCFTAKYPTHSVRAILCGFFCFI